MCRFWEMLLYYAAPRGDTNPAAHALLKRFGTLDGVFSAPETELRKIDGVGEAAAQLLLLVPQVARRRPHEPQHADSGA